MSPILERLILSGEANLRFASIGYNGLMCIEPLSGRSAVITKITFEPFFNIVEDQNLLNWQNFFEGYDGSWTDIKSKLENLWSRFEFELTMRDANYQTVESWNMRHKMQMNIIAANNTFSSYNLLPLPVLEKREINCFHLVKSKTYFFLRYFDFQSWIPALDISDYISTLKNINPVPSPAAGPANSTGPCVAALVMPFNQGYTFLPMGLLDNNTSYTNTTNKIEKGYAETTPLTSIILPFSTKGQNNLPAAYVPSLPVLNVEYVEINRTATTHGIFEKGIDWNKL